MVTQSMALNLTIGAPLHAVEKRPGEDVFASITPAMLGRYESKLFETIIVTHPNLALTQSAGMQQPLSYVVQQAGQKLKPEGILVIQDFLFAEKEEDKLYMHINSTLAKQFSLLFVDDFLSKKQLAVMRPDAHELGYDISWLLTLKSGQTISASAAELQTIPNSLIDLDKPLTLLAPAFFVDLLQSRFLIFKPSSKLFKVSHSTSCLLVTLKFS